MVTKFGTGIDHDDISREFDGQGHRSKVKVIQLKNAILEFWPRVSVLYLTYKGFMCIHAQNFARAHA